VLDIDCDVRPTVDLASLEEAARQAFADRYPRFRAQSFQEHRIDQHGEGAPVVSTRRGLQALQFLTEDEKQVVQVRPQGFSFNRLAPYTALDDYLPEIERGWGLYRGLVTPLAVRLVRLRYINRIPLPLKDGNIAFSDYIPSAPQLLEPAGLSSRGFLNQVVGVDDSTGNEVTVVLATQPHEGSVLPVILDISAARGGALDADDWGPILGRIQSLRRLKNHVFQSTLSPQCLSLFR
jgi:uncharacterized protein (TIGR04255 family)